MENTDLTDQGGNPEVTPPPTEATETTTEQPQNIGTDGTVAFVATVNEEVAQPAPADEDLTGKFGPRFAARYVDGVLVVKRQADGVVIISTKMPREHVEPFMAGFRAQLLG